MDSIRTDIIIQLNNLCSKYRYLQDYYSKNGITILNDLESIITKYHEEYEIEDVCNTNFQTQDIDRNKIYAFIYHINEALGFYDFLQMYQLDYVKYEALRQEAYEYYYQYAIDHMIPSQVDITKIDWKLVKAYKENNQRVITQFFKRK
uniref:Uncharacterized protein n=1 Tax=viral metagenome TaxID=1070528 RepID=A0A6C0CPZ5_9ZZZZ